MFNEFPYTDLHNLNLDWFLDKFKKLSGEFNDLKKDVYNLVDIVKFYFPKNPDLTTPQGDACVIKAGNSFMMIDTWLESAWSYTKDLLDHAGCRHVDVLIISHYHVDHYGGLSNLISNNYINGSTKVYLPAETAAVLDQSGSLYGNMMYCKDLLDDAGIPYTIPSQGNNFTLGPCKVTFYNCSPSMTYTDYNNQSTICLIEHGSQKALFTGDCHGDALGDLFYSGNVTDHIHLYKVGHHGINAASNNAMAALLDSIRPDISVVPTTLYGSMNNMYHNGQQTGILQSQNSKLVPVHVQSNEYIEICMTEDSTWIGSGRTTQAMSSQRLIRHVYVDKANADMLQTGSMNHPYASIEQAIGSCDFHAAADYRIHVAPGTYGQEHSTPGKNMITLFGAHLTIDRWSESGTVNIYNGIAAMSSVIKLINLNLYASSDPDPEQESEGCITCNNCRLLIDTCTINDNTIYGYKDSNIRLDSVTVRNSSIGVRADHSVLHAVNSTFESCATAYAVSGGSIFAEYNTTYNNVNTQKNVRPGSIDISDLGPGSVTSVNGMTGAVVIGNATSSAAGLMSATDKTILDTLYADYLSASTALG